MLLEHEFKPIGCHCPAGLHPATSLGSVTTQTTNLVDFLWSKQRIARQAGLAPPCRSP